MAHNQTTLPCGLRVIYEHRPSAVLYCGYVVCAGTRHEAEADSGMAHFIEHMSFKGTTRRRACHITNGLERVGGDLNAYTTKQETVYYATVLKQDFARAADLLTDIVFHSTYPQTEIDKEVEVIVDEIESYNDSPAELIYDLFENAIYKGHPLGHNILGSADVLRTYTTEDALQFTRRLYRPDNAVFFAYGDIKFDKLVRLLEKAHDTGCADGNAAASTMQTEPLSLRDTTPSIMPPYTPQSIEHHMDTHLAHVMLGTRAYDVHDPRRIALYLLNNILGGPGMNARLNISLRERNALVYTVESMMQSYSDTGLWAVYFGCDPRNTNKCLRLIRRELDRVMQHPLSESALNAAKKQIRGQIGIACDARESFALDFAKTYLHYGWKKDVTALCNRIDALTAADLQQVAQETFAEEGMTKLVIK